MQSSVNISGFSRSSQKNWYFHKLEHAVLTGEGIQAQALGIWTLLWLYATMYISLGRVSVVLPDYQSAAYQKKKPEGQLGCSLWNAYFYKDSCSGELDKSYLNMSNYSFVSYFGKKLRNVINGRNYDMSQGIIRYMPALVHTKGWFKYVTDSTRVSERLLFIQPIM